METSVRTRLGIIALIVFAVAGAVLAALAPELAAPGDDPSEFLSDLEDASDYAIINFGFLVAFLLSMMGACVLPDFLANTRGERFARFGWVVYLAGATLLCAFFATDGVFIGMLRESALNGDDANELFVANLAEDYMNNDQVILFAIIASGLWIVGLGLLAAAIFLAEETPIWIDAPLVIGVILLLVSLVVDVMILAVLGYVGLAISFGALYVILERIEDNPSPVGEG
jgi:hypothetical protein